MRRSTPFLLSSWMLALVLVLATFVGGVTASSIPAPAGAAAGARAAAATGLLCIVKFNDLDGDGKKGTAEPTLGGWVFTIEYAGGGVAGMITTSAAAARTCAEMPAGAYKVTETPQAGWTQTAPTPVGPQTVTIVSGQTTTLTFGNSQAKTGTLCVVKFNDVDGDGKQGMTEATLVGWVFTIGDASGVVVGTITTTATAARNCIDLPVGIYTVTETPQDGWVQTAPVPVGPQKVTILAGQTTTLTFGNSQAKTGTLCIVKFNDVDGDGKKGTTEPTLAGWVFRITDAGGAVVGTITTTAAAARTCIDLAVGTYRVTETFQAGWIQTTPTPAGPQTVTIVAGQTTTLTFGNRETKTGMLCVTKFNDLDGDGLKGATEPTLSGWVFTIKDAFGAVVGTITTSTSATGTQACTDLPAGTYTVTETQQAGWTPTIPVGPQTVTIVAGQTTTLAFGNRETKTGTLCVVKFNDLDGDGKQGTTEPTLGGWVFTITDVAGNIVGTITTTATAARTCIDLPAGTYTLTETPQAGWTQTAPTPVGPQTVTIVSGQATTVTFGNHRTTCCLTFTFLGGKVDNFRGAGTKSEPVTPVSITATPAYFDATEGDRAFAHRFYLGAGNCIQSATLQIKIKALLRGSTNDTMGIRVPGGSSWSRAISAIAPTGTWSPPKVKTVVFDLGAMPSGGGSTNLIPALQTTRILDISVQDDTSVDYIQLIVVFCECVGS